MRQQYLDFLGREPDAAGLQFWTAKLNVCNGGAACLAQQRIEVSAAFFLSQEFKDTGSFVFRLYEGTLGRRLSYDEFSTDRAKVVGGPGLERSKAAFAEAFVQRADFADKYQGKTTAEGFVDALLQTINDASGVVSKDRKQEDQDLATDRHESVLSQVPVCWITLAEVSFLSMARQRCVRFRPQILLAL